MAQRYDPNIHSRTPAAPAAMPARSNPQGTVAMPPDRRPVARQTIVGRAAPVEITAGSEGYLEHPAEACAAAPVASLSEPLQHGAGLFQPKSPASEDELAYAVPF